MLYNLPESFRTEERELGNIISTDSCTPHKLICQIDSKGCWRGSPVYLNTSLHLSLLASQIITMSYRQSVPLSVYIYCILKFPALIDCTGLSPTLKHKLVQNWKSSYFRRRLPHIYNRIMKLFFCISQLVTNLWPKYRLCHNTATLEHKGV